jgi:hypothetical protein
MRAAIKNPPRRASRVWLETGEIGFDRETDPASTVACIRAEVRFVLRVVAYFRLTRVRRWLLAAKPNHGFFLCQQPPTIFFPGAGGPRGCRASVRPARKTPRMHAVRHRAYRSVQKKIPLFKRSSRDARAAMRRDAWARDDRDAPLRRVANMPPNGPSAHAKKVPRLRVAPPDLRRTAQDAARPDRSPKTNPAALGGRIDGAAMHAATSSERRQWSSASSSSA